MLEKLRMHSTYECMATIPTLNISIGPLGHSLEDLIIYAIEKIHRDDTKFQRYQRKASESRRLERQHQLNINP